MDLYLVISETEHRDFTYHYIHFVSADLKAATEAYETVDNKGDKETIALLKIKSDKLINFDMSSIPDNENVVVIEGRPVYAWMNFHS